MTNEEKGIIYNSLIRQHDAIESKIADIKSEHPFGEFSNETKKKLSDLEVKRNDLINQARALF